MIGAHVDRKLSFTIAASSFSKPVIGKLATIAEAIPVKRPEDSKTKGLGKIIISKDKVKGLNSKFIEQGSSLGKGWSLLVGGKTISVKKVISEEELVIAPTQETDDINGKELDFFFVPKIDNSVLFKEAYDVLCKDGAICIFPEGTSHDRPDFIKLKAGIAFMCLGAMSELNCRRVKIVPVGLNYFRRERFRSELTMEFGKPFEVPSMWAEEFKVNKREVTEKLLKEVESRMKAVTLFAPTIEELKAILLLRRVYIPTTIRLSPTQHSELCKRFIVGYEKLKDHQDCKEMITKATHYVREIDEIDVSDKEILNTEFQEKKMKRKFLLACLRFVLFILFVTPILIILLPFIFYIRRITERERLAAKAKNANKIEALDIVSSVKVFKFISLLPLIFLIWEIFVLWISDYYCFSLVLQFLHIYNIFGKLLVGAIVFPVYIYFGCQMFDYLQYCFRTVKARSIFFLFPSKLNRLKEERSTLGDRCRELVDQNINSLPEYKNNRIVETGLPKSGDNSTGSSSKELIKVDQDSIEYLERRASEMKTHESLIEELEYMAETQPVLDRKSTKNLKNLRTESYPQERDNLRAEGKYIGGEKDPIEKKNE
eukprot:CAMPEP_0170517726 /NCGR_PEP_ID=MMETSP0209-20121228/3612_1 /TAXON_ID=665100 ORGANISM="Litonotus pictus, Strain P1" /NCGR_SAMPLE_ID=MMETSP0209 /ASSEMBLY_ACC=CAM_ASM_000301 /LENGTH=599 /DNA_ID=CAMNT_0010803049 /DNA_START=148 /DNA_END=1947 /DNA_ORIENTATION=+